ncbi:MAG: hypothetical protein NXI00_07240 [Cytophagales bacterium]|nr:hypothetical protein [Cytophagales bacterium]
MKNLTILFALFLAGFTLKAQSTIDENGRPIGAKPSAVVSSTEEVFLKRSEGNISSASSDVKIEYSLPSGMNSGKIILFHSRKDQELKQYILNSNSGTLSINKKELPVEHFAAGLYSADGNFLKSLNIY